MKTTRRAFGIALCLIFVGGFCYGMWRLSTNKSSSPPAKPAPAAAVTPVKEDDLTTIKLTPEAFQRLGVKLGAIVKKPMLRIRTYGGEVMAPLGRTILVAAPLSGMVQAAGDVRPQPGHTVTKGQQLLTLLPLLSPEATTTLAASKADADGQIKAAETQVAATKLALERAERLFRQEAGSKRTVEEAQAQHDLATRNLEATQARLAVIAKALGDASTGRATPIEIVAPESGILRTLSALPGQNVPAGGALFEIVGLAEVWVRVPVYVGDVASLATSEPAAIGPLNMRAGSPTWTGRNVPAPPSANALASTVDLYYAVDNTTAKLRPGQRMGVNLPLVGATESLAVPWSGIVHDIHGGTWIYVAVGERTYRRERVVVQYVADHDAALAKGPAPGMQVVVEGAIELFGAETGFSK